ncbi:MAG: guanyl-specific ribonuclease Sa [Herminiimonas sp.]|nr:guanyl-specific ribonuclease Sa [Herminiimonas sp.]
MGVIAVAELPREARQTLVLIEQGGPFPYPKDGAVFGNYEGSLPRQSRGYYREFTVKTPGSRNRGARRLIAGGRGGERREFFYTADHYATFMRITE